MPIFGKTVAVFHTPSIF